MAPRFLSGQNDPGAQSEADNLSRFPCFRYLFVFSGHVATPGFAAELTGLVRNLRTASVIRLPASADDPLGQLLQAELGQMAGMIEEQAVASKFPAIPLRL